jgi:hypothetical protein
LWTSVYVLIESNPRCKKSAALWQLVKWPIGSSQPNDLRWQNARMWTARCVPPNFAAHRRRCAAKVAPFCPAPNCVRTGFTDEFDDSPLQNELILQLLNHYVVSEPPHGAHQTADSFRQRIAPDRRKLPNFPLRWPIIGGGIMDILAKTRKFLLSRIPSYSAAA